MKLSATYGTWPSAISGEFLAGRSIKYSEPQYVADTLYWLESRPAEKGRQTILRKTATGAIEELLPAPWSAQTKVHEYGGGHYLATADHVYFVHRDDQQIYQLALADGNISQLTQNTNCRFADLTVDGQQRFLYCVCEESLNGQTEPTNRLVRFDLGQAHPLAPETVDANHDFVASASVSPCGQWLSYLTWDHPNMPWDGTQVWLVAIDQNAGLGEPQCLCGSANRSHFQPQWSPRGHLFWVSDQSNWWNLYCLKSQDISAALAEHVDQWAQPVSPLDAEFATPQWVFRMSTYGFLDDNRLFASYSQNSFWHCCVLEQMDNTWTRHAIHTPCLATGNITCGGGKAALVGAEAGLPQGIYEFDGHTFERLIKEPEADLHNIAVAQVIEFPTANGQARAHAFFYPPKNALYQGLADTKPPVIVLGHGGPTGACDPSFHYKTQFWTNRGFAVLDVNYRGSTGYGREYRQALQGLWGVVDVEDLCAAADYVTAQGWVHPQQRIIRGGSAGGFSVLAALTDTETFNVGVSLYGVADLETLARDTHKFEARYLDSLVGPYPEQQALYRQRSPIHKVDQIHCPLLVFQGLQDKVVPPEQSEIIVEAAKKQGLPVAYVTYPDEGHGFRQANNICHQVEAELYFYQTVLALNPAEEKTPGVIVIANWPARN